MANPIQYAEDTLGVHAVWTETQARLETHKQLTDERASLLGELRVNRTFQADREAVIVAEVVGEYSELSDTARNRIVKTKVHDDAEHRRLRSEERALQSRLDLVDGSLTHHERGIGALSSRMVELGGLLNFYAAAKNQSSQHVHS